MPKKKVAKSRVDVNDDSQWLSHRLRDPVVGDVLEVAGVMTLQQGFPLTSPDRARVESVDGSTHTFQCGGHHLCFREFNRLWRWPRQKRLPRVGTTVEVFTLDPGHWAPAVVQARVSGRFRVEESGALYELRHHGCWWRWPTRRATPKPLESTPPAPAPVPTIPLRDHCATVFTCKAEEAIQAAVAYFEVTNLACRHARLIEEQTAALNRVFGAPITRRMMLANDDLSRVVLSAENHVANLQCLRSRCEVFKARVDALKQYSAGNASLSKLDMMKIAREFHKSTANEVDWFQEAWGYVLNLWARSDATFVKLIRMGEDNLHTNDKGDIAGCEIKESFALAK